MRWMMVLAMVLAFGCGEEPSDEVSEEVSAEVSEEVSEDQSDCRLLAETICEEKIKGNRGSRFFKHCMETEIQKCVEKAR